MNPPVMTMIGQLLVPKFRCHFQANQGLRLDDKEMIVTDIKNRTPTPELNVNFIKVQSKLNWDEYFMLQAMLASFRSKDPNTKVGCVFVDENNHQITMGYNGAIAGVDEEQIPWGNDRRVPLEFQKYGYVMHSEANAISHATRSLKGARAYVTLFPCNECAKLIASHGVGEVVYLSDKYDGTAENRIAKRIFELSQIKYRQIKVASTLIDDLKEYLLGLTLTI